MQTPSKREKAEAQKMRRLKACPACGHGPITGITKLIDTRGMERFPYVCTHCGTRTQVYCRKADVPQNIRDAPAAVAYEPIKGQCERCGQMAFVERHHWAPRHLFGAACEQWPTASLCHACHKEWHDKVTPNMANIPTTGEPDD